MKPSRSHRSKKAAGSSTAGGTSGTRLPPRRTRQAQVSDHTKERLLKELEIDGTALLQGVSPGSNENVEHRENLDPDSEEIAVDTSGRRLRERSRRERHAPNGREIPTDGKEERVSRRQGVPIPMKKKKVQKARAREEKRPSSKRKQPFYDPDNTFLVNARRQYKRPKLKPAENSSRAEDMREMVPFLDAMECLSYDDAQTEIDQAAGEEGSPPAAYVLGVGESKRLLASTRKVLVPIFVQGGARSLFDGDERRPMEQALVDWFIDEEEINNTDDVSKPPGSPKSVKMAELRQHFLSQNGPVRYPFNFPDIANPLSEQTVPEFVQSVNCSFLRSMMRRLLDVTYDDICQDACSARILPDECCNEHRMTVAEMTELHEAFAHWTGTLMLADAGAGTHGHWDKWGLGTWIACYEGEIGFCWQSQPSDELQHTAWQRSMSMPDGRYLLKVLRPGDALYMPHGTVHYVFRLPEGKQTVATAGHTLRKSDADDWLYILKLEVENVLRQWTALQNLSYPDVVPALVRGAKFLLAQATTEQATERFGGEDRLQRAKTLLEELSRLATTLTKKAAHDDLVA